MRKRRLRPWVKELLFYSGAVIVTLVAMTIALFVFWALMQLAEHFTMAFGYVMCVIGSIVISAFVWG